MDEVSVLKSTARMPESILVDKKMRQHHPTMAFLNGPLDVPHLPRSERSLPWRTIASHKLHASEYETIRCKYSHSNQQIRQKLLAF